MKPTTLLCATILAAALVAESAAAAPAYHPPQTAAEQTLARILMLDAAKPAAVDPTIQGSNHRPLTAPPPGAPYLKYLTTPLATSILAAEARQVKANCGGVYKRGEECGMDSDPIICAQDFPKSYLVRSTQSGPGLAVIEAAWPPDPPGGQPSPSGTYRLKLTGGAWKIDGISCSAGDSYNWSSR